MGSVRISPAIRLVSQCSFIRSDRKEFQLRNVDSLDHYAALSLVEGLSPTVRSGRYEFLAEAESRIPEDVSDKTQIDGTTVLLDIGFGAGQLLDFFAERVRFLAGFDSPAVVARYRASSEKSKFCSLFEGDLRTFDFNEFGRQFDVICIYSVLHCLSDWEEVLEVLDQASDLLAPGGRLLVGDLPNVDKKQRFLSSEFGKRTQAQWEASVSQGASGKTQAAESQAPKKGLNAQFDDASILGLVGRMRRRGFDASLLPQNSQLPFGFTREDILVTAPRI